MKVRNVQKSGNMHYIYLPSKWCKDKNINVGSRLEVDINSSGNLELSTKAQIKKTKLELDIKETDPKIISKIAMGCFLNPLQSFKLNFKEKLNHKELLKDKKLLTTTLLEINSYNIYSEPLISIDNPLSVFVMMANKSKNLIKIMIEDFDEGIIRRFEEEIDWSNTIINKSVIASFMHKRDAKRKLIELHYLSMISNYLERAVDRVLGINIENETEKLFLKKLYLIFSEIYQLSKLLQSNDKEFNTQRVLELTKMVQKLEIDENIIHEMLIKKSLRYCSEVFINWSISNTIE